jgi:arylsulfatase A-like enzyme
MLVLVVACYLGAACNSKEPEAVSPPNVIFILADDLGYGDISAFNPDGKIHTPNIDLIAHQGMRFTDAHTTSSVCTPTRYGILTGRYNWRTRLKSGVLTGKSKALIPNDRTTVASLLKKQGYFTAFVGKWHLGWDWAHKSGLNDRGEGWDAGDFSALDFGKPVTNSPNDLGFDYAYGHSGSLDMAPYVYVENGMPTAVPDTTTVNTGKYSWWREGPTAPDFDHDDVTPNFFRKAMAIVDERSKQNAPFFLYLALPSPHTPILPTADWQGKSGLNPYADFVLMIDDYVGQLLRVLEATGAENNTLIFFTSDNGCSPAAKIEEMTALGHFPSYIYRGHKADIFEGGHRVPFAVRWPDQIAAGSTCNQTVCTADLMATVAQITGYAVRDNEGEDSYSLLPLFKGNPIEGSFREATVHHSINGSFAIRKGPWKLIMCPGSGGWSHPTPEEVAVIDTLPAIQLYNLETNPSEDKNEYATYPEIVDELQSLLIKYIQEGRSTPGIPQENDATEKEWNQINFVDQKEL